MRYPLDGSGPTPLTVLNDEDKIIQWTADRKALLVGRAEGPLRRADRVDPIAGTRQEVRLITPADRIGLQSVTSVAFADNADIYAYTCVRSLSHLFLVEGAR
jgi:hypothetical protein